jgi:hypothetical protein
MFAEFSVCYSVARFQIKCFPFKMQSYVYYTHEPLHAQCDETNDSIEFLQPYPFVASGGLLEIVKAVVTAVLSLDGLV